jgi:hypothetical protein
MNKIKNKISLIENENDTKNNIIKKCLNVIKNKK